MWDCSHNLCGLKKASPGFCYHAGTLCTRLGCNCHVHDDKPATGSLFCFVLLWNQTIYLYVFPVVCLIYIEDYWLIDDFIVDPVVLGLYCGYNRCYPFKPTTKYQCKDCGTTCIKLKPDVLYIKIKKTFEITNKIVNIIKKET